MSTLSELDRQIDEALDYLTDGTEIVRRMIMSYEGRESVKEKIKVLVLAGESISDSIRQIDDEYDINYLD